MAGGRARKAYPTGRGEQRPVGGSEPGSWALAVQDGELVAQHQDLRVLAASPWVKGAQESDVAYELPGRVHGSVRWHLCCPGREASLVLSKLAYLGGVPLHPAAHVDGPR
jgi:hypothetical protein